MTIGKITPLKVDRNYVVLRQPLKRRATSDNFYHSGKPSALGVFADKTSAETYVRELFELKPTAAKAVWNKRPKLAFTYYDHALGCWAKVMCKLRRDDYDENLIGKAALITPLPVKPYKRIKPLPTAPSTNGHHVEVIGSRKRSTFDRALDGVQRAYEDSDAFWGGSMHAEAVFDLIKAALTDEFRPLPRRSVRKSGDNFDAAYSKIARAAAS